MTQTLSQLISEMQALRAGLADGSARNAAGEPASGDIEAAIEALDGAIAMLDGDGASESPEASAIVPEVAPYAIVAAAPGAPDDLRKIRGISSATAYALTNVGITRHAHIAGLTAQDVAQLKTDLGYRCTIHRDNWIEQASILASGQSTSFSRRGGPVDISSRSSAPAPVPAALPAEAEPPAEIIEDATPEAPETSKVDVAAAVALPILAAVAAGKSAEDATGATAHVETASLDQLADDTGEDDVANEPISDSAPIALEATPEDPATNVLPAPDIAPMEDLIDMAGPEPSSLDEDLSSTSSEPDAEPDPSVETETVVDSDEDTAPEPALDESKTDAPINGAHVVAAGTVGALIASNLSAAKDLPESVAPEREIVSDAVATPDVESVEAPAAQPEILEAHAPVLMRVAEEAEEETDQADDDDVFASLPAPVAELLPTGVASMADSVEPTISVPHDFLGEIETEAMSIDAMNGISDEPSKQTNAPNLSLDPSEALPTGTIPELEMPALQQGEPEASEPTGLAAMLDEVAGATDIDEAPAPHHIAGAQGPAVNSPQSEAPFAPIIQDLPNSFSDTVGADLPTDAERIQIVETPAPVAPEIVEPPVSEELSAETLRTELEAQFSPEPRADQTPLPDAIPAPRLSMAERLSPGAATIDPLPEPFSPHKTAVDEAEIVIVRDGKQEATQPNIPELSDRGSGGGLVNRISRMFTRKG